MLNRVLDALPSLVNYICCEAVTHFSPMNFGVSFAFVKDGAAVVMPSNTLPLCSLRRTFVAAPLQANTLCMH